MNRKGLSLIEILVSAVILSLVMTGLVGVFLSAKRHIRRPYASMAGGELERYLFSDLQMEVSQDQWGSNCLSSFPTTGCPNNLTIGGITYNLGWDITDAPVVATTLRKVRVTLTWTVP